MAFLTNRRLSPELMDNPQADAEELASALRYLRTVNKRLGGTAAAMRHFKRWARHWQRDQTYRVLDLGTGSADIPLAIADWAKHHEFKLHVTGVDLHPVTVQLAREWIGSRNDITLVQADALKLMDVFSAGDFEYAHAGMFLHHLTDLQVMTVLRIMDRLATRGIIWNDLVRGLISKIGVRVLTLGPGVSPMVRHDGIVSVEAGFTRREAHDLASRAGLKNVAYHRHLFHRFTLVSEKQ